MTDILVFYWNWKIGSWSRMITSIFVLGRLGGQTQISYLHEHAIYWMKRKKKKQKQNVGENYKIYLKEVGF